MIGSAGHNCFTVNTCEKRCTGTVVASVCVGAIPTILAQACLATFIYIVCAVLPSPTRKTDTAVSGGGVRTLATVLAWCMDCTVVNVGTDWTDVVACTVAGIVIPHVHAGTAIQARLGGTQINVLTAGVSSPPRGTGAGECWNTSNHNIRAKPTI